VRLAVYTDYAYHQTSAGVQAERAFALFVSRLRRSVDELTLIGRLSPGGEGARYPVGDDVGLLALPYYSSLANPSSVLPAMLRSMVRFWRLLDDVDCLWLLGPHPTALAFVVLALMRRKRVVLGVRQDLPTYVARRHPDRRWIRWAGWALELAFRGLARFLPVVVVGPDLAAKYSAANRLLEIVVSVVESDQLVDAATAAGRDYDGPLQIISVGRLEAEKNPLLLADVLALLNADDGDRWRLLVCGEGEMKEELASRLAELGQADNAVLAGYMPYGAGLVDAYRSSHLLLHTSWTEGFPQILIEAAAAGVPVVAADVGGIRAAMGDALELVPPGDPAAAAAAVKAVASDPGLRARMVEAGLAYAAVHTLDAETGRVMEFIRAA
jgi:glycosyltransferase involved in cell wall biosynthesis